MQLLSAFILCIVVFIAFPSWASQTNSFVNKEQPVIASSEYGIISVDLRQFINQAEDNTSILKPIRAQQAGFISTHRINNDESRVLMISNVDGTRSFYNGIIPETRVFNEHVAVQEDEIIGLANVSTFSFYNSAMQFEKLNRDSIYYAQQTADIETICRLRPSAPMCQNINDPVPTPYTPGFDPTEPYMPPVIPFQPTPSTSPGYTTQSSEGSIDAVSPFQGLPDDAVLGTPRDKGDGCSAAAETLHNEHAAAKLEERDAVSDAHVTPIQDFNELSCFDVFQANMFGPVADNFTNASSGILGGITSLLGDKLGGLLSGLAPNILDGLVGADCVSSDGLFDSLRDVGAKSLLDSIYTKVGSNEWATFATEVAASNMPENYMKAIDLGRFYDPDYNIIGDKIK